jgi:hypothetical protein
MIVNRSIIKPAACLLRIRCMECLHIGPAFDLFPFNTCISINIVVKLMRFNTWGYTVSDANIRNSLFTLQYRIRFFRMFKNSSPIL